MVDFWSEMGFDVQRMMCCRSECEFRPACHGVTGHTVRLNIKITTYNMIFQRD